MKTIEEQLICLNFELKTISGIVNFGQLERWVPGYCNINTDNEHIERYRWVSNFVKNNNVLDIACGVGRGSYMLAEIGKAKKVTGCDIDPETIQYASIKNKHSLVTFKLDDAEKMTTNDKFETIISFETIEHLKEIKGFLESIQKVLKEDGYFFVSTPISRMEVNKSPTNTYHQIEWGFLKFQNVIEEYFDITNIYLQLYPNRSSFLKKIFDRLTNKKNKISNMVPFLWDKEILSLKQIQDKDGYQILQCKQKNKNIPL